MTNLLSSPKGSLNIWRILWPVFVFLFALGQTQRLQLTPRIACYGHDLWLVIWLGAWFVWQLSSRLDRLRHKFDCRGGRGPGSDSPLKYLTQEYLAQATTKLCQTSLKFWQQYRYLTLFFAWSLLILGVKLVLTWAGLLPAEKHIGIRPWLYLLRLMAYLGFAYSLTQLKPHLILKDIKERWSKSQLDQLNLLTWGTALIPILIIAGGFAQYWLMPDARHLARYGWDVHYYRLMGLYLDPNFTGLLIVLGLINWLGFSFTNIFAYSQLNNENPFAKSPPLIKIGLYLTALVSLLLTYSRSSYLAFLLTAGLLLIFKLRRKLQAQALLIGAVMLGFIASWPLLPRPGGEGVKLNRTSTIQHRVNTSSSVIKNLSWDEWLVGRGLFVPTVNTRLTNKGKSQPASQEKQGEQQDKPVHAHFPDNLILFLISGTGVIGFILFSLGIGEQLIKLRVQQPYQFLLIMAVLVHSLFNLSLHEPFVLLYLLVSLAISSKW
jgi:hypothetical protein